MENNLPKQIFWDYTEEQQRSIYQEIFKQKNVTPKAAEKDWWVCHVIASLFSLRCADALTFKGGTSLSKAWGVTERFSEDVDVSIDKSFFGLTGDTRSARDRIRKLSRAYIHEQVLPELAVTLSVYGATKCEVGYKPRRDSDADPTVLIIPYYSVLPEDPNIKAEVKVELSCRNPREPRQLRPIVPYAAELSPILDFPETIVPTVTPERTFLEKVFLLHEEFQKNYPRHRRMSRHLYDLYRLDKTGYADTAMADTALYRELVHHRSIFNAIRGIDYSRHTPENLSILPPEEIRPLWEADYLALQSGFIFGETPSFPELISHLTRLQERLREIRLEEPLV